ATGAERGTLFLNDAQTGELYSRIALGNLTREIRILNTAGLAGFVYTSGEGLICHDPYADDRFSSHVDEQTDFVTKNVLCAPVKTVNGETIGVVQTLNKIEGQFTEDDLAFLKAMATQAAGALQSNQIVERMEKSRIQELEFLDVVSEVSSEIQLGTLLQKIMGEVSRMLDAERSTLFMNDEKSNELWSEVGSGLDAKKIRFPNHKGIAGAVFTSGESVNIPHAYADLRFNPAVDKETGVVKIKKFVAVQDQGLIINRKTCESQVRGGLIMGIAASLYERRVLNRMSGAFVNADLGEYKLARLGDIGEVVVHLYEPESERQRGVIGNGEPPAISPMAAISNAVCNAIGVRVSNIPLTPKRVLTALKA
ncbi:MAG: GAF domain-containing protein, partial [Planctomycetes bacterium]|nr:GAF domain-containing protein [Planctomycetota bacterium]